MEACIFRKGEILEKLEGRKNEIDEHLEEFRDIVQKDERFKVLASPMTMCRIDDVVLDRSAITSMNDVYFSNKLDDWKASDQKSSGRCWIFAGTTLLQYVMKKRLHNSKLQLSRNYFFFWDKFERANFFLEMCIASAHLPAGDRFVSEIFDKCGEDGGQFDQFVTIVSKYGCVPQCVYPETVSSNASLTMKK
ncbi:putative C1 family peptidase [Monocercomonoides exilis]|uniref:putative C1 family peptidase n=1 Tax=Monocercomonoides exilis TaxID=2049356 RepID=UPI0035595D1E|nr:putative C1 family peptidase [Monocercomonoides exilis]